MTMLPEFVHLPTPGDHYSPATGSAIMTDIYEMSRFHARAGGRTRIIVSRGTRHDYQVGQCVEVAPTHPPVRWQTAIDVALSRLGLPRPFTLQAFAPATTAIERDFAGVFILHNCPVAVRRFKRHYPQARVCLSAHNELFATYSDRDAQRVVEDSTFVICVSRFIADSLKRRVASQLHGKIVVIHNGVDSERFCPNGMVAEGPAGLPVVLFLGRVTRIKGPDLLLKAARKIHATGRRFIVRIVGSRNFSRTDPLTPYELELRRLAIPLGDAVQFRPFVDRTAVVRQYQQASIFCAPANWDEPFGLTLAEAMACGLPVVTSRRGGIPEVCGDAALYFDPPDVDTLAERLSSLLDDAALRETWSRRARERACELTWERHHLELVKLFGPERVPRYCFLNDEQWRPEHVSARVLGSRPSGVMSKSLPRDFIHVPTPGDHYSPATGSAVMTIIYEMSRIHARLGGRTQVIVSQGTHHDYDVGECIESARTTPPPRWQRAVDAALAWGRFSRPFESRAFRPARDAIDPGFNGVVFVHNSICAVRLMKRRCPRARICLWAHNELFRGCSDREIREVVEDAALIICVSQYIANRIKQRLDDKLAAKVVVVHNGVDIERFCSNGATSQAAPPAPVVLFLGRVIPVKGPDLLLKAAGKLLERGCRFIIRIVGSSGFSRTDPLTPYEQELRRLAKPLGEVVQFQPFVNRKAVVGEYQRASIFCAPANWDEPFGLTLVEAMACRLPVVTSRRGGIPEVCGDAALYFDPPDIDSLADRLGQLLDSPEEREQWSQRARCRADQFDWPRQYAELTRLLES